MTEGNLVTTKAFYEHSYGRDGFGAQRRYPNEELCRFMGMHFFSMPREKRKAVRILEVGCGSGANLWMVAREGFDACGVDLSEEAIKLCERMLTHYDVGATLAVADMTACPFLDQSFDAVVDVFSAYCLDEAGFRRLVCEVRRLLKPGGKFFCYTPSKSSDAFKNSAPSVLLDPSTLNGIGRKDSPFAGNHYPFRFATNIELTEEFALHGFHTIYSETVGRTYAQGTEHFAFCVVVAEVVA